ncbi:MAG TPA: protein-tyrosine-phosphatase, partial [Stellaceae bacterium]|nr:protein-tyrosine-phosphatase [Stellaceae bacterium]
AHLLIHCHAGISRSTAAAVLLLAQADPSRLAPEIFEEIARLRPRAWPNLALLELGEEALGRPGEFTGAVGAQYRRVIAAEPSFAAYLRENGRGREVEIAELPHS